MRRNSYESPSDDYIIVVVSLLAAIAVMLWAAAGAHAAPPPSVGSAAVSQATDEQKAAWLDALAKSLGYGDRVGMRSPLAEALSRTAAGGPCSVGYMPAQFAARPNPWPGDVPLPNDQLLAAYIDRYGQAPGNPSNDSLHRWIPGYVNETSYVSYGALENAANGGGAGPNGEHLHSGCVSTVEYMDFAFSVPKGSPYVALWYVSKLDGGSADNPIHVHTGQITQAVPCGPFSLAKTILGAFPIYYFGESPCGGTPPPPPPVCGNGVSESGETCDTCPADQPPHACDPPPPPPPADHCSAPGAVCMVPPAPCPALAAIPQPARTACKALLGAKNVNGQPVPTRWRQWLSDACEWLPRAESYKPGVQSTAQTRLVLLSQRCAP